MAELFHILNGDALLDQFPGTITGEQIVVRECLIEGPVTGATISELYQTWAAYLDATYREPGEPGYLETVVPELEKIGRIPKGAEVNLWFEDDLFCQVNCWYVAHLLQEEGKTDAVYLVRPPIHTPWGFGGLDQEQLEIAYANRFPIADVASLARLWIYYQQNDNKALLSSAQQLGNRFPFVLPAVEAHLDRFGTNGQPGRPERSLLAIMDELQTDEFAPVFREFYRRESIYGFGDLQVKRLFDQVRKGG